MAKTVLAILWLAFTFSLVAWWWVFLLFRLDLSTSHRMFAWEGSILLAAILLGGVSLVIFSYRDQKRHQRMRFFFSTFSHDIKTSIARLRLQAEVLEEDLQSESHPVMKRLIHDIQRLDLQLENSLLLSSTEDGRLLQEEVLLSELLSSLRGDFSELSLELEKDAILLGDRRALLSVFKNLLQNSVLHGKAHSVQIRVTCPNSDQLQLKIQDDGVGFKGPMHKLGADILKSQGSHSNGIGLLITKRLLKKMHGSIRFETAENAGFISVLNLQGRCK